MTFKGAVMYVSRHDSAGATVEVSSIPSSVRQDTLVMLFENTKRSGGGDVQSIDYVAGSGRARITFKDSAGMCLTWFVKSQWVLQCHCLDNITRWMCGATESDASVTVLCHRSALIVTGHFFFSYACCEPGLVSHKTVSSSAECSRDKPPFSFVRGQDLSMVTATIRYDTIVCI